MRRVVLYLFLCVVGGEVLTSVATILNFVFSYLMTSYHMTLLTQKLPLVEACSVWHCQVLWRGEGLIDAVA